MTKSICRFVFGQRHHQKQDRITVCFFILSYLSSNLLLLLQPDPQLGDPSGAPGIAASPGDLMQCEGCGRSFNPKAFEIHSRICAKVFQVG